MTYNTGRRRTRGKAAGDGLEAITSDKHRAITDSNLGTVCDPCDVALKKIMATMAGIIRNQQDTIERLRARG